MKILLAGATGVLGRPLIPRLVAAGHTVIGTSRHADRLASIAAAGAEGIVMDALDGHSVGAAMRYARPDAVMHQLTDLSNRDFEGNSRLRTVGTRNLVDAAREIGVERVVAQSISWVTAAGNAPATEDEPLGADASAGVVALEEAVSERKQGVVLRYGLLYGPGTWYAADGLQADAARRGELRASARISSFVHVTDAVSAAIEALHWPAGIVNVVDDEPASADEWMPAFAAAVGAPEPAIPQLDNPGRPISNARAHSRGWHPRYATWRAGFSSLGKA